MKDIKNVILCGMGAIGSIYADIFSKNDDINFKVLVDNKRLERYTKCPIIFNGSPLKVDYILPDEENFHADLIIIATKRSGLDDALLSIKNFVSNDTIILSLLNGVTSEYAVADAYGREHVLYSYFIGHSSVRVSNSIVHDGVNFIVFGSDNICDTDSVKRLKSFFDKSGVSYRIPEDIRHSMWSKFMLNVSANPTTALFRKNFGQMMSNKLFIDFAIKIMKEVEMVASAEGIKNTETLISETIDNIKSMVPEGKTSMLQDIESGRKTEIETFSGTVSQLGDKYGIATPYCDMLNEMFAIIEYDF